jgi:type IV pilus assembly protein PilB
MEMPENFDLTNFQLDGELLRRVPVELMFRYNFVPLEETSDGRLAIAVADPAQLLMIYEISALLHRWIVTKRSPLRQIEVLLKKIEQGA